MAARNSGAEAPIASRVPGRRPQPGPAGGRFRRHALLRCRQHARQRRADRDLRGRAVPLPGRSARNDAGEKRRRRDDLQRCPGAGDSRGGAGGPAGSAARPDRGGCLLVRGGGPLRRRRRQPLRPAARDAPPHGHTSRLCRRTGGGDRPRRCAPRGAGAPGDDHERRADRARAGQAARRGQGAGRALSRRPAGHARPDVPHRARRDVPRLQCAESARPGQHRGPRSNGARPVAAGVGRAGHGGRPGRGRPRHTADDRVRARLLR